MSLFGILITALIGIIFVTLIIMTLANVKANSSWQEISVLFFIAIVVGIFFFIDLRFFDVIPKQ